MVINGKYTKKVHFKGQAKTSDIKKMSLFFQVFLELGFKGLKKRKRNYWKCFIIKQSSQEYKVTYSKYIVSNLWPS